MADWAEGYVSEIGYTYGYYGELNPTRAAIHFLKAGLAVPKFGVACELGFGQGMSINAHSASSAVKWYGTDFNPAQAGFAQELSEVAGSSAQLFDQSFEEFCNRDDLPKFDFIGLHGIWSWISDNNRQIIVDFIRRKLKVGGVVYISYNTLPGWAAAGPLRHILAEHRHVMTPQGQNIEDQVGESIDFVKGLIGLSTRYTERVPFITKRMEEIGNQNRSYLAHEYFNRDWQPMYFSQLQNWLSSAKVSFACSASFVDDFDVVQLNEEQRAFLQKIPDRDLQQTVRDYLLLRQFRRDYWVKGYRKINKMQQAQAWRELSVILLKPREDISLKVAGAAVTATLKEEFYSPIFDELSAHGVCKVVDLERKLASKNIDLEQIAEAIVLLNSRNDLAVVQDENTQKAAKKRTTKLNRHLMEMAVAKGDVNYLVSSVTGSAVPVARFDQIFLLSVAKGNKNIEQWVEDGWSALALQNRVLLKDGKKLEGKEENVKELTEMAETFKNKWLPLYKALNLI